ncbi:Ca(2+)-dependent cysteine protease [Podila minutissima]|nr:Ca(2+)-dependent cysteine protease [Podila minutissima]
MSQEQGEPIIHKETVTETLPDGRIVTKTRIRKTYTHQVQVPAGTPLPPGAQLVSSTTVQGTGPAPTNGNGQTTYHYQESSSSSGYNGEGGHSSNGSTGNGQSVQYSAEEQQQYDQFNQYNNAINSQHGGVVKTEPTVVVQSTIDDNGRKVTKTTTTTSSSSGGKPNSFSKFFKRFSLNLGKSDPDLKPLPSIPTNNKTVHHTATVHVTQTPVAPSPEPEEKPDRYEPPEEVRKIHIATLEVKKTDGPKPALSDCTGERRALLIGINYTGLANPLHGCVNDTAVMKKFLLRPDVGFAEENIRVLTDDQVGTEWMPTRENIFRQLKWLIQDAKENDSYFLHYSGHGGQIRDLDGDETEGQDNCIFPVDHVENGVIVDDELHREVVKKLPPRVRLTAVFDCCHSGSALDLPYIYASTGYIRGSSALANLGHELVEGNFDAEALKALQEKWQKLQLEEKEFARQVSLKAADADVIMFSGCKDDQTSADVSITRGGNTSSNGAMTYAFTKCISQNREQSYQDMLNNIRDLLKEKYKQKPQLSSSRPMDMQEVFRM